MNPFTTDRQIQDVASDVRHELFILSVLLVSLAICSDVQFEDCAEEATSLIIVARERLGVLLTHADNAVAGMGSAA